MDGRSDWQRRLGVGERQHLYGRHAGGTNTSAVIADDGPRRGTAVGTTTEHWSGRVDATATAPVIHHRPEGR